MPRTIKPKRRQRRHGALPAGFRWRGGRPRWEPSPARRRAGWRGCDLKDVWGGWLAEGAAIDKARALAAAVAAWCAGEPVPPAFLAVAPKGAVGGRAIPREGPHSIGRLLDDFLAEPRPHLKVLGERTRADYRVKLARLVGALAGAAGIDAATLRAVDVAWLLPPPAGSGEPFWLDAAYRALASEAGEHMAHGCLAAASAWLTWVVKARNVLPSNPALSVRRATPAGRIVVFEWAEIRALVAAADAGGAPSIGDAIVLALDLSWSQQDILALDVGQVSQDFNVRHRRIKTGVAGNPRLLKLGQQRLEQLLQRRAGARVQPTRLVVREGGQGPWAPTDFRHRFAEIRAVAAAQIPAIAGKQFRDLRDTAVTYAYEAGLTVPEICSRTLHDPARAEAVLRKHYGALRQELSDQAADKLEAHFARQGWVL